MDFKEIMEIADNMDVEATAEKILAEMEKAKVVEVQGKEALTKEQLTA